MFLLDIIVNISRLKQHKVPSIHLIIFIYNTFLLKYGNNKLNRLKIIISFEATSGT